MHAGSLGCKYTSSILSCPKGRCCHLRTGPSAIPVGVVSTLLPREAWPSNASFQPISQSLCHDFVDGLCWALTEMRVWNWTLSCIYIGLINRMTPGDQDQPCAHSEREAPGRKITSSQTAGGRGSQEMGWEGTLLQVRVSSTWAWESRNTLCMKPNLLWCRRNQPLMKSHLCPPFLFLILPPQLSHIQFLLWTLLSRHLAVL